MTSKKERKSGLTNKQYDQSFLAVMFRWGGGGGTNMDAGYVSGIADIYSQFYCYMSVCVRTLEYDPPRRPNIYYPPRLN